MLTLRHRMAQNKSSDASKLLVNTEEGENSPENDSDITNIESEEPKTCIGLDAA